MDGKKRERTGKLAFIRQTMHQARHQAPTIGPRLILHQSYELEITPPVSQVEIRGLARLRESDLMFIQALKDSNLPSQTHPGASPCPGDCTPICLCLLQ